MAHILKSAKTLACNATIHGHSYKMKLGLIGDINPETGMLVDFSKVSELCRVVHNHLDHALWVSTEKQFKQAREMGNEKVLFYPGIEPTAENMVIVILHTLAMSIVDSNVFDIAIELWETKDSSVSCILSLVSAKMLNVSCLPAFVNGNNW